MARPLSVAVQVTRWRLLSRVLHSASAVVLLLGCTEKLPTAPSELAAGIAIYEHANYMGASAHVRDDIADMLDIGGGCRKETSSGFPAGIVTYYYEWNDCISSVRVAPGWRATVYEHPDFKGEFLEISADVANLQLEKGTCSHGGLNDCISSIRLRRP